MQGHGLGKRNGRGCSTQQDGIGQQPPPPPPPRMVSQQVDDSRHTEAESRSTDLLSPPPQPFNPHLPPTHTLPHTHVGVHYPPHTHTQRNTHTHTHTTTTTTTYTHTSPHPDLPVQVRRQRKNGQLAGKARPGQADHCGAVVPLGCAVGNGVVVDCGPGKGGMQSRWWAPGCATSS